ncbi:MAG: hypothetical protein R2720_02225 [Candidatus Nanopelagicales bacterium]
MELHTVLRAHVLAAVAEVYPTAARHSAINQWPAGVFADLRQTAEADDPSHAQLTEATIRLIEAESDHVVTVLDAGLEVCERRHLGKVFRIRRDASLRKIKRTTRRRRSQTELYEVARRAGVQHRSSMTQAQLQAAIEGLNVQ